MELRIKSFEDLRVLYLRTKLEEFASQNRNEKNPPHIPRQKK